MNKFYYWDCIESEPVYYEIITDLTKNQLIDYITREAFKYCEENGIDPDDYCSGNYTVELFFQIKVNEEYYYKFSLMNFLSQHGKHTILDKVVPFKLKINKEDVI